MSKAKRVRYTWAEFCAKMDWEGTDYMATQLDPINVPKELEAAQAALKVAYDAWNEIIEANFYDSGGEV
jgi:hypothetical protein